MNQALLVDLADCGAPETIIAAILKHHPGLAPPIPIDELAFEVGIVAINGMAIEGFEGALMTDADKKKGTIIYKEDAILPRRRFTVAHELGHFLIPWHKGDMRCTRADMQISNASDPVRKKEAEANRFAAGVLMPKPLFQADMRKLGEADVAHILTLSHRYETSVEATVSRYVAITDDCCAFVFSHEGLVRYFRATKDFPRLAVRPKDKLPSGSLTARMPPAPLRQASEWIETEGDVWLETEYGKPAPRVLEQGLRQKNGYQITLLMVDRDELEQEDEDAELEESYTPRFRRR